MRDARPASGIPECQTDGQIEDYGREGYAVQEIADHPPRSFSVFARDYKARDYNEVFLASSIK